MFGNSWRVGRVFGVELRIDVSWAVIAVLVSYSLYARFQFVYEGITTGMAIGLAVASAILFFGSVLIHEFAHALVAKARGIPVQSITLFLFGGATHAKVESKGPGAEFLIAIVGPLTSLALAGVFGIGGMWGDAVLPVEVAGALGFLAYVNLILAIFNLVPGFPLDGGRVLRAIIWRISGSVAKATRWASYAGQAVGYLMVASGLFFVFNGVLTQGIWFAAIGWFLAQAARVSYEQMRIQHLLEDVDAQHVMATDLHAIPADLSLQEAVNDYFMRFDHGAFPVEDDGHTAGLVTLRSVKEVPRERWEGTRVREAMSELDDQLTVSRTSSMADVMEKLQDDHPRVLVTENGYVVGIITSGDLARWLQRRQVLEG